MAKPLKTYSNKLDHTGADVERQDSVLFGERLRERAKETHKNATEIARAAGIKRGAMTGYWAGERIPPANKLFGMADFLRVHARWLASGEGPKLSGDLMAADEADYVQLPLYDLDNIDEGTKGPTIERVPFRRDWLYRFAGPGHVLWMAHAPNSFRDVSAGAIIICSDIPREQLPYHNQVCVFLGSRPFIAKYSEVNRAGMADVVTKADLAAGELHAIAHVRGSLLNKVDLSMEPER